MANFPGNNAYPINPDMRGERDGGPVTKNFQTGIARGGTTEDYNADLRGLGTRDDAKPKKPFP